MKMLNNIRSKLIIDELPSSKLQARLLFLFACYILGHDPQPGVATLQRLSFRHGLPRSLHIPKHLSPCSFLISRIYPHLQNLFSRQDIHRLLSTSFQVHFFLGTLLIVFLFFPVPQASVFPNLNRLVQKHNMWSASFIAGSVSGLFINWRIWDINWGICSVPLFSVQDVSKIYNQNIIDSS